MYSFKLLTQCEIKYHT